MAVGGTKVVQVTNIAPQATKDQMQTLFGYLGKIEDIRLYPTIRDVSCPVQSRICYIKFIDSTTVGIAQHMTNTVFIDRALIVIPVPSGDIPDEYYALEMTRNGSIVPGLCPSEPKLPPNVVNSISGTGSDQVIVTTDPQLDNNGLTPYPPLPANYDSCKIEEIRRTILAGNIESSSTTNEITDFFSAAGEVKYLRSCTVNSSNYYLVEFSEQPNILEALNMDGKIFKNKPISVAHSTQAIVKPQAKSNEAAQREIEEAMSRVKEAQSLISAAIDPVIGMLSKDKRSSRRSRSRSRGRRRRSRSRSRSRRSRSRDRRRRSRSRSRDRRRRSRSKKRSRSRSRRSRSRRSHSRRSRSKSPKTRKERRKSRDRSREKSRDKRSREKERDRSRERSSRRDVKARSKDRSRDKDHSRDRDRDKERRDSRGSSKDKRRSREKESREKRSDKESSIERDEKIDRRRSRSISRSKYRSRSRDRKSSRSRDKKRSRSRDRRKRSVSRERRRRSRSKSRDRKKDKRDRKDNKNRSRSRSKVPRNYDEEEKGFDSEREKSTHDTDGVDKESSEKSDNMDISNSP